MAIYEQTVRRKMLEQKTQRIAELEAALRAIADEVREAHDGGCIWPVRKILHAAGFNAGIVDLPKDEPK